MSNKRKVRRGSLDDTADVQPGRRDLDPDDDGVTVSFGPDGRAMFKPRWLREASPAVVRDAEKLQSIAGALALGQEQLTVWVERSRRDGMSWERIGWCLGITGEAVRKRFGE